MTLDILTAAQVADALGCDPDRVSALASSGHLPAVKYGRSWRFPAAALKQYLEQKALDNLGRSRTAPMPEVRPPKSRRKPPLDFTQLVRVEA
ncbi:helix-turn-helix domain-containing protein [Ralstonia sp. UBA689]|uniref:helix-turn-helix domain-containing protein n=1 Tax=Ralstonia sp. UBA689 TaxID=1947373 RepID=UPI0039C9C803